MYEWYMAHVRNENDYFGTASLLLVSLKTHSLKERKALELIAQTTENDTLLTCSNFYETTEGTTKLYTYH